MENYEVLKKFRGKCDQKVIIMLRTTSFHQLHGWPSPELKDTSELPLGRGD